MAYSEVLLDYIGRLLTDNTIALYITIPRTGVRGRVTRMPHYRLSAKCDFISAISSAIDFAIDTKISIIFFIKFFVFSDNFLILTKKFIALIARGLKRREHQCYARFAC